MKTIIGDRQTGKTTKLLQFMIEEEREGGHLFLPHYIGPSTMMCDAAFSMMHRLAGGQSFPHDDFLIPSQAARLAARNSSARFFVDDWHLLAGSEYLGRIHPRQIAAIAINITEPEVIVLPVHAKAAAMMVERAALGNES